MSSPLAIAAVTAVLRDLLNNGLVDGNAAGAVGGAVTVSASPPDIIKIEGTDVQPQLNLYLYQVTHNQGWRNAGLPSRDSGGMRLTNPPLALDLHYMLTSYGKAALDSEILLGYAMHLLHETPVLDRQAIRTALSGGSPSAALLPPAFQGLNAADLADQVERIKITPSALGSEEISKLWSAFGARYRPTAAYQVSVVLIEAAKPLRAVLPVLTRGERDPATNREAGVLVTAGMLPPYPTLYGIDLPNRQVAARLGDQITLSGHHLSGTGISVRLEHARAQPVTLAPDAAPAGTDAGFAVTLPSDAAANATIPAGAWSVTVYLTPSGQTRARESNSLPLMIAPRLDLDPARTSATRDASGVKVSLAISPDALPGQRISLAVGAQQALAEPLQNRSATLDFKLPASLAAGPAPLRLLVDGAESLLVDRSATPPAFDATQTLVIPP